MAHKTLISGTAYEIKGGRTLVGGTGYDVKSGRTLVGGTGYDMKFSNFDPSKMQYTQAEFIQVINEGNAGLMPVGASITLNNSYCNTFDVIGTNHDGTSNTVDIMSRYLINLCQQLSSFYEQGNVRNFLNNWFFPAFDSEIRNLAKQMSVRCYSVGSFKTFTDYVKALSATEIGGSDSTFIAVEGTKYPAFTNGSGVLGFTDAIRTSKTGGAGVYWLRTQYKTNSDYFYTLNNYGNLQATSTEGYNNCIGVLRF